MWVNVEGEETVEINTHQRLVNITASMALVLLNLSASTVILLVHVLIGRTMEVAVSEKNVDTSIHLNLGCPINHNIF